MGYATQTWNGDGVTRTYEINFVGGYLDRADVKAYYLDIGTFIRTEINMATVVFEGDNTLRFPTPTPVTRSITIYRETPRAPMIDFVNTSRVTEANLNRAYLQSLFISIEAADVIASEQVDELLEALSNINANIAAAQAAAVSANASKIAAEAARNVAQTAAGIAEAARLQAVTAKDSAQASAATASGAALQAFNSAADAMAAATSANASRVASAASQVAARASELAAIAARNTAVGSASSAAASAGDASVQAGIAQQIAADLASGSLGFTDNGYDFGSIATPVTYFNRDLGSITDPI